MYAALESYGMLVCTELNAPTTVANTEYGLNEYDCVYSKCKKIIYYNEDYYRECPLPENTNDFSGCTSAGDVLIDEDQMFNEEKDMIEDMWN